MAEESPKPEMLVGTGSPGSLMLEHWGRLLYEAFDEMPYQVGSSIYGKTWRDVDVRIIMDDEKFDALFGDLEGGPNAFWSAMMTAFSLWGERVTGFPVDFQIHKRSSVRQADWEKARVPIGLEVKPRKAPAWRPRASE